ncbi:TfoX/Sxy family protein [Streptomyces sp. 3214.6]|uniref:TfoX/Sxy family protein n=1 Tax=Streptomyces sp. 3214.6 TaxID=1882757 RepID=UPI00090BF044|nr:TfoX/Sxy family protein [Streptomyces sp. 3214.6]SHI17613.1 DNA transformation protein [Streptomyces sp. 3214.6]
MSGSRSLAEHVADQLAPLGGVTVHRYFGGWALRSRGIQFAIVMDTLYLRVDDATRLSYEEAGCTPFTYRAAGRAIVVHAYYSAPAQVIDDRTQLCVLARAALA